MGMVGDGHMTHDPACPRCKQTNSRVLATRVAPAQATKRRRVCVCGYRFTTYEVVDTAPRFRALYVALQFGRTMSS